MAATKKATGKSAASKSKGAAAKAEKKGQPKKLAFRGLKLTMPAKLPGTILFDIREIEHDDDGTGIMALIRSVLGEEQYRAIYDKVREDGLDLDQTVEALSKLLGEIMEAGGLSEGE